MKKTIIITLLVAAAPVVLLGFVPGAVEGRLRSVAERIEAAVEELSPGLYCRTLPADDLRRLADELPELRLLLGDRPDEWLSAAEDLSLSVAVDRLNAGILSRTGKVVTALQLAVVVLAVLVVAALALHRKERRSGGKGSSSSGVVFGE